MRWCCCCGCYCSRWKFIILLFVFFCFAFDFKFLIFWCRKILVINIIWVDLSTVTYSIYLCSVFFFFFSWLIISIPFVHLLSFSFSHWRSFTSTTHTVLSRSLAPITCTNTVVQGCFSAYILSHIRGQMHCQFLAESRARDRVRGETKKKRKKEKKAVWNHTVNWIVNW